MSRIFLVRHGAIDSNRQQVYAGWSEENLNPDGITEARSAAAILAPHLATRVYSSPLARTMETARIIAHFLGVAQIVEVPQLKEMRLGPWEGLSESGVADAFPWEYRLWNEYPSRLCLPGRETLREVQDRALAAVSAIKSQSHGHVAVAVTHVAIIRTIVLFYQQQSLDEYKRVEVGNGCVFMLDDSSSRPVMRRLTSSRLQ